MRQHHQGGVVSLLLEVKEADLYGTVIVSALPSRFHAYDNYIVLFNRSSGGSETRWP